MTGIDFKTYINGVSNDLKTSIDDIIGVIIDLQENVAKLKVKTSKPDKATAQALLEYIAMENCKTRQNMEALCGKEIEQYMKWLDSYCEEYGCTQEQSLNLIITGEI